MKVANYNQHNKIKDYYKELHNIIKNNNLNFIIFDKIQDYEIGIIPPKKIKKNRPNILIVSGFHGNEPAGVIAILRYLEKYDVDINVNISIIPIINPTGYMLGTRNNYLNEDTNRHYLINNDSSDKKINKLSEEGKILMKHIDEILYYSKDGFLTLHEDVDESDFYFYVTETIEEQKNNKKLISSIKNVMSKYFKINNKKEMYGEKMEDGIIKQSFYGAFDDLLFYKGVKIVICTETPGKKDINDRINANINIIKKFISYYSSL